MVRYGCNRSAARGGMAAVGLWLAVSGVARADVPQKVSLAACRSDLSRLCSGVEAGGGKKMHCLMQNESQLSADCDAAVKVRVEARGGQGGEFKTAQAMTNPAKEPPAAAGTTLAPPAVAAPSGAKIGKVAKPGRLNKKACRAELATMCSKVEGSRTKCLIANQAKLGPDCAAAVAVVTQTRQVAKAACVTDGAKLCGTARGVARTACLEANKAQLSPECLARMNKKEARQSLKSAAPGAPAGAPPKP